MPEVDLTEVLHSGKIANGPNVAKFEQLLQEYIGNPWITTTADVSSSITLCLYMAGVRPGDEVICSPMACLATNMPILNLFAKPVWADINIATGALNTVANQITLNTKAILAYDWAGNPFNIRSIGDIAGAGRRISIIEDASEGLGSKYLNHMAGSYYADYSVFSFSPAKHITTGEGAAIAFSSSRDYEQARWLKKYGIYQPSFRDEYGEINPDSDIKEAGYYTCMNEIQAAIGIRQMAHLREIVGKHQANGLAYDEELQNVPGITLLKRYGKSAYWVYTFYAQRRDDLLRKLRECGIYASKVHSRCDAYSCFGTGKQDLPGVAYFEEHQLSIPCGWWVTEEDREYIVSCIKEGW